MDEEKMSKTLIIGSANTVLADLKRVDLKNFDHVIAVNKAILLFPGATHWITLHPENLPSWESSLSEPLPEDCVVVSFKRDKTLTGSRIVYEVDEEFEYLFEGQSNSGSSGLYAVKYALERLNSSSVVLAGVPMDPQMCHYSIDEIWEEGEIFWSTWVAMKDFLIAKNVRSLSGRTMDLLGAPE